MAIRWTRPALEARLEALKEQHSGDELIGAVVGFADTLTKDDKRLLQDVLLTQARRDRALGKDTTLWIDDMRWRFLGAGPREGRPRKKR